MMMTVTLYHSPMTRSSSALWMLEEIAKPYGVELVDTRDGRQRATSFLAVNPLGKVPALDHDGTVITETCAILTYLADLHPEAKLIPPIGHKDRGAFLRWMYFYAGCWEPAIVDHHMKRDPGGVAMSPYGTYDAVVGTVAKQLEAGPYMVGQTFSAADVIYGAGLAWMTGFGLVKKTPAIEAYIQRVNERPARKRANEKDAAFKAKMG
jgi:glutathione S-transferase